LRCETTEDKNHLGCDRVDDVANLVAVHEQINELSNLEIVDCDHRVIRKRYDKVALSCAGQFYSPRRNPKYVRAGEVRRSQVGFEQRRTDEPSAGECCTSEVRRVELRRD